MTELDELRRQLDSESTARQQAEAALHTLTTGGQFFVQHFKHEPELQVLLDQIRHFTQADFIVFKQAHLSKPFPYQSYVSGDLLSSTLKADSFYPDVSTSNSITSATEPIFAADVSASGVNADRDLVGNENNLVKCEQVRSVAAVPLCVGTQSFGILFFNFRQMQNFTRPQKHLICGLANYTAIVVKHWSDISELIERQNVDDRLIDTLIKTDDDNIETSHSFSNVMQSVLDDARRLVGAESGELHLYEDDLSNDRVGRVYLLEPEGATDRFTDLGVSSVEASRSIVALVSKTRTPYMTSSARHDDRDEEAPNLHSEIAVPLLSKRGECLGVLSLESHSPAAFDEKTLRALQAFAVHAVVSIQNMRAHMRIEKEIQARREAEQRVKETSVMSSVGQGAYELTHRLGNDLGLVRSYVENIREKLTSHGVKSDSIDEYLNEIVLSVRSVLEMSLSLKRGLAEYGSEPLKRETIPVKELLQISIESYSALPANIQIRVETPNDLASIHVVPAQITHILSNLLFNAVEAMPEGGTITLRARNAGAYVEIEVEDTGVGIPLWRQEHIFDLFYSTKGNAGFGLWSARRYALENNGDLRIESEVGKGAIFRLLLPVESVV